jgi:hypothetical protein
MVHSELLSITVFEEAEATPAPIIELIANVLTKTSFLKRFKKILSFFETCEVGLLKSTYPVNRGLHLQILSSPCFKRSFGHN